jgi:starch synthase
MVDPALKPIASTPVTPRASNNPPKTSPKTQDGGKRSASSYQPSVVFATAELAPLVRVGGLAEAAAGLVLALRAANLSVHVVLPDYGAGTPALGNETVEELSVPDWVGGASARTGLLEGFGEITLVTVPGIARPHPYGEPGSFGWEDNDKRFFGFSAAIAAIVRLRDADVLHCNDWHTSPAIGMVDPKTPTVLSLHNLAYQGQCHIGWTEVLGEFGDDRKRAYERYGECNPLAGALRLAHRIIAVSPNYAKEIRTPQHGAGLDDILSERGDHVIGIINGIDHNTWSPDTDQYIAQPYSAKSMRSGESEAKAECKRTLLSAVGLPQRTGPVIGFVSRLVDQKGVDFAIEAAPFLESIDATLIVLGSGDADLVRGFENAMRAYGDRIAFRQAFDLTFAHQIFAGSDLFIMPSRFEPCGLAQMQAMAYGTIPVVTDVGGLHDTVIDADRQLETGNGFVTSVVSTAGLVDALHRAVRAWSIKKRRAQIIRNGMQHDWSWKVPASDYVNVYKSVAALQQSKRTT